MRIGKLAMVRVETLQDKQMQADFGQSLMTIAGERLQVHLGVMTRGYSRRIVARAYLYERQENWLRALEEAFRHRGGARHDVLVDNA